MNSCCILSESASRTWNAVGRLLHLQQEWPTRTRCPLFHGSRETNCNFERWGEVPQVARLLSMLVRVGWSFCQDGKVLDKAVRNLTPTAAWEVSAWISNRVHRKDDSEFPSCDPFSALLCRGPSQWHITMDTYDLVWHGMPSSNIVRIILRCKDLVDAVSNILMQMPQRTTAGSFVPMWLSCAEIRKDVETINGLIMVNPFGSLQNCSWGLLSPAFGIYKAFLFSSDFNNRLPCCRTSSNPVLQSACWLEA